MSREIRQFFTKLLASKTPHPAKELAALSELKEFKNREQPSAPPPKEKLKEAKEKSVSTSAADTATTPQQESVPEPIIMITIDQQTQPAVTEEKSVAQQPTEDKTQPFCDYPRHRFFPEEAGAYQRLADKNPVNEDRLVEDTSQLVAVYNAITTRTADHYRLPLLKRLAIEVVEQMSHTHFATEALLQEAIVLGQLYHPQVMHYLLQAFHEAIKKTNLIKVELLEGLADVLEQADVTTFAMEPEEFKLPVTHHQQEEDSRKTRLEKMGGWLKSGLKSGVTSTLRTITGQTKPLTDDDKVMQVQGVIEKGVDYLKDKLTEKGLITETETKVDVAITERQTLSQNKGKEIKTEAQDSQGKWDNVDTLVKLLQALSERFKNFNASSSNQSQQVRLLKALVRVLDAATDLQIDLQSLKDESGTLFTENLYQQLLPLANSQKESTSVELSLYANYGIQALLRLPAESNWLMGAINLGGSVLTVFNELTQMYKDGDVLGHAQTICGEVQDYLKIKHAPEPWYDALRFCQYAIAQGEFKALESYLFGLDAQGESLCLARYNPIFQLGLLKSLDDLIVNPNWPAAAKAGAFKLLQSMLLEVEEWTVRPEDEKATGKQKSTWEKIKKTYEQFKTSAKNELLYFGKAYQSGWVREQLLRQLRDYLTHPQLQAPEIRLELVQSTLVEIQVKARQSQDRDLQERVEVILPRVFEAIKPRHASEPPSRQLFLSAQKRVQQSLEWKIDECRSRRLTDPGINSELSLYVPPRGLKTDPEKSAATSGTEQKGEQKGLSGSELLYEDSCQILGLTAVTLADSTQKQPESLDLKEHKYETSQSRSEEKTGKTRKAEQSDTRVLLLLGRGGSGKSTFGHFLEQAFWKNYQGDQSYLPVFISLTTAKRLDAHLIPDQLQSMGFTPTQIQTLKGNSQRRFVFILDGYDEINSHTNLYQKAALGEWPGARLIISSRPEHLNMTGRYRLEFAPAGDAHGRQVEERWMAPFTPEQRADYLARYVEQGQQQAQAGGRVWEGWQTSQEYLDRMKNFQGLEGLIGNPYMLKIVVEVLPEMDRERQASGNTHGQIKRIELFDVFIKQWFKREAGKHKAERAEAKRTSGAIHYHFQREDSESAWMEDYQEFCEALAAYMFKQKDISVVYQPMWRLKTDERSAQLVGDDKLDHFFSDTDPATRWVRQGCPLTRQGVRYSFLHKLMYEYFLAKRMHREMRLSKTPWAFNPSEAADWEFKPRPLIQSTSTVHPRELRLMNHWIDYSNQKKKRRYHALERLGTQAQQRLRSRQLTQPVRVQWDPEKKLETLLINIRPLKEWEPSLVQFLVDLAQQDPLFQRTLFHWVLASRDNPTIANAAAIAATVLNLSGINLCGRDWHGVRIPGANLRYGNLAHMNLSGADLVGANLTRTWLYGANLKGAILEGVEWGEQPRLKCKKDVKAIAFHPREPWLAIAQDNTVEIRHQETGELVGQALAGHQSEVTSVLFSPNGQTLASGSKDETVRLWSVVSREPQGAPLTGHKYGVESMSFSPDGQTLAVAGYGRTVLWPVGSREPQGTLLARSSMRSVCFSPDGQTLASGGWGLSLYGGDGGEICLWSVVSRELLGAPLTCESEVMSVSFSPDGQMLASGNKYETVQLWSVSTRKPLGEPLTGHKGKVKSVSFSPDGQMLASGGEDKTVRLWSVSQSGGQAQGAPLTGHDNEVTSVSFSPDGRKLASSGGYDQTVRLWSVMSREPQGVPFTGHQGPVMSVSFSPDGQMLASGSHDQTVRLWSVMSRESQDAPFTGHQGPVMSVSFSPDGLTLASGSGGEWKWSSGEIRLWSVMSREPQGAPLTGHNNVVTSVSFSPDGQTLASSSDDKTVRLWSVAIQKQIGTPLTGHDKEVGSVSFSPDGQILASAGYDDTVRLWSVASGEQLGAPLIGHERCVYRLSFSPDGKLIASGSEDRTVRLWSVSPSGGQAQGEPLIGHTSGVFSVSFSPDGQTLASGSEDNMVALWSVASHRVLSVFVWSAAICSIAFQRWTIRGTERGDSQLLVIGDGNGVVSFWLLSARLFRDTQPTEVTEVKAQPSRDDGNDDEIEIPPQPSASEWRLLGSSRNLSMQLWTPGVQLSGCRMSLLSKRLLQQTGADVSGVIVPTVLSDEKSLQESKYETGLPKLKRSEPISTDPSSTSASASLSSSQSMSTSSSTSMSSSAMLSSITTSSSSSTAVLTTPGGPGLMPRPRASITPRTSMTQPRKVRSSDTQCVVS